MASEFAKDNETCEEVGCSNDSRGLYYVQKIKETKKLCECCATNKGCIVSRRKIKWSCDKHRKLIKFYCKSHNLWICQSCATVGHRKECVVSDMEDVIRENKSQLCGMRGKAENQIILVNTYGEKLIPLKRDVRLHFKSIENEIRSIRDDDIDREDRAEETAVAAINRDADTRIQEVEIERQKRLEGCHKDANERRRAIEAMRHGVLDELNAMSKQVQDVISTMEVESRCISQSLRDSIKKIDQLLQDDAQLLREARQVISSVDGIMQREVKETAAKYVWDVVKRVVFVKGKRESTRYQGRIDGYLGKWKHEQSIQIPQEIKVPKFAGYISDYEVVVVDRESKDVYVINIATHVTEKVIQGDDKVRRDFQSLDNNSIICGSYWRYSGQDVVRGCVSVYDRQWRLVKDIFLRNDERLFPRVICSNDDGLMYVFAEEAHKFNIYLVDPTDESVKGVIPIDARDSRGFEPMISGDIVLYREGDNGLTVIDRFGAEKKVISYDDWSSRINFHADRLTNTLYVTDVKTPGGATCTVYRVSDDGEKQTILHFPLSARSKHRPQCVMTSAGKLVTCNDDTIFIFKKVFSAVETSMSQTETETETFV